MPRKRKLALAAIPLAFIATALVFGLVTSSSARQTAAQKSFRRILLGDSAVDPAIKLLLRDGGFVEPRVLFADLTGEGKSDAVVFVNSGAISGTVASYVLSAERGRELRVVHVDESGYQVSARVRRSRTGRRRPGRLILEDPVFSAGDPPCCARRVVRRTYSWSTRSREFRLISRKRVRSGVRVIR